MNTWSTCSVLLYKRDTDVWTYAVTWHTDPYTHYQVDITDITSALNERGQANKQEDILKDKRMVVWSEELTIIQADVHTHTQTDVHTHTQADVHTHIQADVHTHTQADVHTHTQTDVHTHTQTDVHTHTQTDVHTHTQADVHTHTQTDVQTNRRTQILRYITVNSTYKKSGYKKLPFIMNFRL